jgi:4-amino-4-deoxy-L-arabinose transferase-like glycosyltransferase
LSAVSRKPTPTWRVLLPALAAGLLLRLACIAWTTPLALAEDEARFWDLAGTRMAGTAFLPPLYPFVLALLRGVAGDDLTTVRILQAILSLGSIALIFLLAERHAGPGEGRTPVWLAACWPALIYYDGRLRSESITILLLLAFAALWSGGEGRMGWRLLAGGVMLGGAALARPELLLLPPALLLIGLLGRRGGAWCRVILLLPGLLLLVVPWSARNLNETGTGAVVSSNGGYNFWKSFNGMTDGSQVTITDFGPVAGLPEHRLAAEGYRAGWEFIRAHPLRSLALVPAKWGHLFGPERDLLSDLRRHHLPDHPLAVGLGLALLQNLAWFGLLSLGLYALIGPARSPVKETAVALLVVLLTTHAVFFGDDRFHVPLIPFLLITLPEAWDGSRRAAAAVRLLGLGLVVEAGFWGYLLVRDLGRIGTLFGGG